MSIKRSVWLILVLVLCFFRLAVWADELMTSGQTLYWDNTVECRQVQDVIMGAPIRDIYCKAKPVSICHQRLYKALVELDTWTVWSAYSISAQTLENCDELCAAERRVQEIEKKRVLQAHVAQVLKECQP